MRTDTAAELVAASELLRTAATTLGTVLVTCDLTPDEMDTVDAARRWATDARAVLLPLVGHDAAR